MKKKILPILALLALHYCILIFASSCAQIGSPTGGPRDSLAPVLVKSEPALNQVNFTGNKISFSFNEYIELQDLQANVLVSPLPKNNLAISSNLKTVTVKFKDSLLPNTTYSIHFGDAIKDVNEGNILKDFTYTFSTGNAIDSLELNGSVRLAESGKTDSTLSVMLYRDAPDSAVTKRKPDYMAKLSGRGTFRFSNLPPGNFKIYALKDGDGGKTYNAATELFAFHDAEINTAATNDSVLLYAYAEEKAAATGTVTKKKPAEKKLRYANNLEGSRQDLLLPLEFTFNNPIKTFDTLKLVLTDTNYTPVKNTRITIDSTRKILTVKADWVPESYHYFLLQQDALEDSSGNTPAKTDTIRFMTKSTMDYGTVTLRFKNLDLARHPVLQYMKGEDVQYAYPLKGTEWSNKMFPPGEYEIRILYDDNNNGQWDPGNYREKRPPEKAITLPQRLSVRADWDNERDIEL